MVLTAIFTLQGSARRGMVSANVPEVKVEHCGLRILTMISPLSGLRRRPRRTEPRRV